VFDGRIPEVRFRLSFLEAGAGLYRRTGVALPPDVFDECRKADAIFLGACGYPEVTLPDGTEVAGEVIFKLRFGLDLYAGVRPVKLYPGMDPVLRNQRSIDYIIVRENTEGLYAGRGGGNLLLDEIATDTMVISRRGTERIVRYAFEMARSRNGSPLDRRRRVTCVDKANVLRSYAFFRKIYEETATKYPDVEKDYAYVDAMVLWMVQQPRFYDVVVAENMFGDILSDLGAGTVGGMGMAPSGDIGDGHGLFQPAHGSAPSIAGKGVANPIAAILSAGMMLEWLGKRHGDKNLISAAQKVEEAVSGVLAERRVRTSDLGGDSTTAEVGDAIAERLVISSGMPGISS
jgi:3-isopropylmalate dehydrogenase